MRNPLPVAVTIATLLFVPAIASAQDTTKLQPDDMEFVKKAVASGMAEVELGKLGTEKATNPDVKQFSQRMVDDHTKANEQLTMILQNKNIEVSKDLPPEAKDTKEKLSNSSGADFDREFMKVMVSDHEKAVDLFTKQSQGGQDPQLKQFAEQTLPILRDHLDHARQVEATVRQVAGNSQTPEQQTAPSAGATATQQATRPPSPFGQMTAEDLIGQAIVNKNGDKVGKIDDIVLDRDKAVYAIVSVGGFLGIGAKHVAIPFDQLQPGENKTILMSSATKDQLKAMPEYKKGEAGYTPYPRNQPFGS